MLREFECARCGEPTTHACLRCAEPLCERHVPGLDERCARCESEFRRERVRLVWRIVRAAPAASIGALVGGLLALPTAVLGLDVGMLCIAGGAALGAGGAGRLFDRWRERRRRLSFLREPGIPSARLLEEPGPER